MQDSTSAPTHGDASVGTWSRRRFTAVAASVFAQVGIASSVAAQASTPAASASPSAGAARVVETIHGPVTVPENPQRVVAISFPSAVTLLEIGIMPVGRTNYLPKLAPGTPDPTDIPIIESAAGELDVELITSLEPDLIVGSDWTDPSMQNPAYELLPRIAPTVIAEWTRAAGNWREEATLSAEAVGKSEELTALRNAYESQVETIKSTYADVIASLRWDIISGGTDSGKWYLYGATSSHGEVVTETGIQLKAAADQDLGFVEYSTERFDILKDTDVLLAPTENKEPLMAQPAFTGLPAITANHFYTSDYFFPSSYGISTALLQDIEDALKQI
ncbi:MAG TPA: ABC transporter substrate-binding protein [Thermomicrobiales bacterium]|nr:ABC transporter substrate-binding protein [Thermomicrobiales bacterium]